MTIVHGRMRHTPTSFDHLVEDDRLSATAAVVLIGGLSLAGWALVAVVAMVL